MRPFPLAVAGVVLVAGPAAARRVALVPPLPVAARAAVADVAVVGTVTAIEPATVPVPLPGTDKPVPFRVAVVKVDEAVRGAGGLTHVRVGFPADTPPRPRPAPGAAAVKLEPGQKLGLFLVRHPAADFFVIPPALAPVDVSAPAGKAAVADMHKAAKVAADPAAALKAADAKDRAFAAMVLVAKYRTAPVTGAAAEEKPVAADESALVLAALAEQTDWDKADPGRPSPLAQFRQLGVGPADGMARPRVAPGTPFAPAQREAFVAWLAGPGKDYRIKALVPKAAPKPATKK